jgi:hypothetical protein
VAPGTGALAAPGGLPLLATEVGRRTLEVGQRRLPLDATGRPPVRLVLSVGG